MGRKYYLDPTTGDKIYIRDKVPSLAGYRKKADQDVIDATKVDKVNGKGLSTNDYDNTAKTKVDAIPSNPKYTDTVYDDTSIKASIKDNSDKDSLLWQVNEGTTYTSQTDSVAGDKTVVSNAKACEILSIGGHSEVSDGEIIHSLPKSVDVVGKNFYDEETYPMTNGLWISSNDGYHSSSDLYKCTLDYIPCKNLRGKLISIGLLNKGSHPGIAFYKEKNVQSFISGYNNSNYNPISTSSYQPITVPVDANYLRFTVNVDSTENFICIGRYGTYSPYKHTNLPLSETIKSLPWHSAGSVFNELVIYEENNSRKGKFIRRVDNVRLVDGEITGDVLSTPIITDVTSSLGDLAKMFDVEAGGSISIVQNQDYDMDVPFSVEYVVKKSISSYDDTEIRSLITTKQNTLTDSDKQSITKTGMTSGSDWTSTEQANARKRIGLDKEWVLKCTIAGDETDRGNIDSSVTLDLSGCTEIHVLSYIKGTGSISLLANNGNFLYLIGQNGTKYSSALAKDFSNGMIPYYYKQGGSINSIYQVPTTYDNSFAKNQKISEITNFTIQGKSYVTECNIRIYAR